MCALLALILHSNFVMVPIRSAVMPRSLASNSAIATCVAMLSTCKAATTMPVNTCRRAYRLT